MTKKEREEKAEELENEFDRIKSETSLDISKLISSHQDLPEFEAIDLYDYNKDIDDTLQIAKNIVESLADMYLSDVPEVRNHIYIKNKVNEDSMVYANVLLTERITRKNYIQLSRQIDSGDQTPSTIRNLVEMTQQMRENSKYQATQRTSLEKFYREFRTDFGLKQLSEQNSLNIDSPTEDTTNTGIVDGSKINDMIDDFIKNNGLQHDAKKRRG